MASPVPTAPSDSQADVTLSGVMIEGAQPPCRNLRTDDVGRYTLTGPDTAEVERCIRVNPAAGRTKLIGQSQTFPDGSIQYSEYRIGGTSLASPLLAVTVAVAVQVTGGGLGF